MFKKAIPFNIEISASCNRGFIVKVSCATLVFVDSDSLLRDLKKYLDDPNELLEKYEKHTGSLTESRGSQGLSSEMPELRTTIEGSG